MSSNINLYSKRDIFLLDNLKAAAICLIFFYHFGNPYLLNPFYSFMIPMFAFASGFSFKNNDLLAYTKKIVCLYILGNFLYLPLTAYSMIRDDGDVNILLLISGPNIILLWYILALIVWACLTKLFIKCRYPLLMVLLAVTLFHGVMSLAEFTGEYSSYWTLIFKVAKLGMKMFVLFFIGVLIPWHRIVELRRSKLKYLLLPITIALMCYLNRDDYFPKNPAIYQPLLYVVACVTCIFTWIAFFPGFKIKLFTNIGKASLNIYLLHTAVIILFLKSLKMITNTDILDPSSLPSITVAILQFSLVIIFSLLLSSSRISKLISLSTNYINNILFRA